MGKLSQYSIGGDSADRKTAFFFSLPFGIAGRIIQFIQATQGADQLFSLANEEEQIDSFSGKEDWGGFGQQRTSSYEEPYDAYAVVACMFLYVSIAMENYTRQFGYDWIS